MLVVPLFASAKSSSLGLRKMGKASLPKGSLTSFGTNSGGGGNLLLGKPIDHYVFDFKGSPEYAQVDPVIQIINKYLPEVKLSLYHTLQRKVWYKVPVKLQSLPGEVIGTPFSSKQGALQTLNAVWISGLSYDAKTTRSEDKALLIMHEILLGLRYGQLNGGYILCQTMPEARVAESCRAVIENPLQPQDYDQIRNAAHRLMKIKKLNTREVAEILHYNGFKIGSVEINETSANLKNLDLKSLQKILVTLAAQNLLPSTGTILSNQLSHLVTDAKIQAEIKMGSSHEEFAVMVKSPEYRLQKTYRGFSEVIYSDTTDTNNSVLYLLRSRPSNAKPGDVVPSMMVKFTGGTLVSLELSEEVLKFSPNDNKNIWMMVEPDETEAPAHIFIFGTTL